MKRFLRNFIPRFVIQGYHFTMAHIAAWYYGRPSESMVVIGVTGTKGKSTTVNIIGQLLEANGILCGYTSTATMKVGNKEWLSDTGMTMLGRFQLQRLLRDMVQAGVTHAIIETSSEGIEQFRHAGIHYDMVVLTNLTPEHIEAHGSYEAYRAAKGKLFTHLKNSPIKKLNGRSIPKRVVLNKDASEYDFYHSFNAGAEWRFGLGSGESNEMEKVITGKVEELTANGATIRLLGEVAHSPLLFVFNVMNVVAAVAVCRAEGLPSAGLFAAIPKLRPVPGRQEFIAEGQPFTVMVDYTHEPTSMRALYEHISVLPHRRVLHVLGPTGGGRDRWRRPVLGEIAAQNADVVIATTDDPYDDDPDVLAGELFAGAQKVKEAGRKVEALKVVDRREAINKACRLAGHNDLVLITGRGAEQKMAVAGGRYVSWDDRQVAREALRYLQT
ncbi:hypothetical protein COV04_00800 [Candidatus Uhrbacteria bacterium CG10_big_fil_rev_8_21_14_0_10_48_11]|uniref:UDP-N-acetylmuramoyl-L-alanyl-D-glutamate--2, 6-diaminopimelate ligase n=1 Tax=Candidatus Uhrbacteria bacterium CG10_big_fil_rev_8_21_14_0_10_48_11 TaxID=1975037 RepID=A0A2M8LFI2_9BACT|nr:MAG: hypothetical protein COV04_00800 [Candidatus Uhrbacteria bacterium CG10_big_fil_rev_8_21_14_0_10_48_11]